MTRTPEDVREYYEAQHKTAITFDTREGERDGRRFPIERWRCACGARGSWQDGHKRDVVNDGAKRHLKTSLRHADWSFDQRARGDGDARA